MSNNAGSTKTLKIFINLNVRLRSLKFSPIVLFLLTFSSLLNISSSSKAQRPSSAIIMDYNPARSTHSAYFRFIGRGGQSSQSIERVESESTRIGSRGSVSVPNDGQAHVSFAFDDGAEGYGGLLLQTRPRNVSSPITSNYQFPCEVDGQWIIAWQSNENQNRSRNMCGDSSTEGGITIKRDDFNLFSSNISSFHAYTSGNKQDSDKDEDGTTDNASDDLFIEPGSEATVIRTVSTPYRTFIQYYLEPCVPGDLGDFCQRSQIGPVPESENIRLLDRVVITLDAVTIEVLEGEVQVSSEQQPNEVTVSEGQSFTYPNEEIEAINSAEVANSCEILKFLNLAYWSSPAAPTSVSDGIAAQLRQHREELGVAGRPPDDLSVLEQGIFDEINRVRANPVAYAALLEENRQYLLANYLNLPGETVDSSARARTIDDAIALLKSEKLAEYTLPALSISRGMTNANRDHIADQGETGEYAGHTGTSEYLGQTPERLSGPAERLRRYGAVGCPPSYDEDEFENIVYFDQAMHQGAVPTSQAVVMEMLMTYRPRRTGNPANLFNPDFQVTGVACGKHSDFLPDMCVVTYANGYQENDS